MVVRLPTDLGPVVMSTMSISAKKIKNKSRKINKNILRNYNFFGIESREEKRGMVLLIKDNS